MIYAKDKKPQSVVKPEQMAPDAEAKLYEQWEMIYAKDKKPQSVVKPEQMAPDAEAKLYEQWEMIYAKDKKPQSVVKPEQMVKDEQLERAVELLKARDVLGALKTDTGVSTSTATMSK
jgi:ethanolamine utilization cobalamin adenosyltransferase